ERNLYAVTGILRGLLDASATGKNDQIRERHFLAAGLRLVELALHGFECLQHASQLIRLIRRPVLLRRETNARPVSAAALVRATEGGGRGPRCRHELRYRQARRENLALEARDVRFVDQRVIDGWNRVLPQQLFLRHLG